MMAQVDVEDESTDLNEVRMAARAQAVRELGPGARSPALGAALVDAQAAMRVLAAEVSKASAS